MMGWTCRGCPWIPWPVASYMLQQSPREKNRNGVEASIGMRETVTSLKFKVGKALGKHNLNEKNVPLSGNEIFVVITKERNHFRSLCILGQVLIQISHQPIVRSC